MPADETTSQAIRLSRVRIERMKKSPLRMLAAVCIVAVGFCYLGAMYAIAMRGKKPGLEGDYIGYWAAGQQLIRHADPYDPGALLRIETAAGFDRVAPSITPSPPVTFLLLLPLGLIDAWTGLILWGMAMMAALAASLWMLWSLSGRPNTLLPLLGFCFAPAWVCMFGGQIGLFFLVSVTAFFYFIERGPLVAGVVLLPCVMKPHLFLTLGVVLLLWILDRRAWRVLGGFMLALGVSTAVTLYLDPHVFTHYAQSVRATDVVNRVTPTLPVLLRHTLAPGAAWLEFLPAVLSCVWGVWFYARHRAHWSWLHEGLLVLLVARLCAPYAWFSDEAIILPAVMIALLHARKRHGVLWLSAAIAAVELAQVFKRMDMKNYAYAWTAPAWLAWYLYATRDSVAAPEETRGAVSLAD